MAVVIPVTGAQARHAKAVTELLRADEPPLGLERTEFVCPVCQLVTWRETFFGLCVDDARDLGLPISGSPTRV